VAEYDNTNHGFLMRNEQRRSDKSPEYTGTIDVGGTEYRLAAWVRESKAGRKFFSLAVSSFEDRKPKSRPAQDADDISL
jgi:uncharacterized protein (DUF736 family)